MSLELLVGPERMEVAEKNKRMGSDQRDTGATLEERATVKSGTIRATKSRHGTGLQPEET